MTRVSDTTMKAFNGDNPPVIEAAVIKPNNPLAKDDTAGKKTPNDFVIDPKNKELFKTPEINPNDIRPRDSFDDRFHGKKSPESGDKQAQDRPPARTTLDSDGSLKKAEINDGSVNYGFEKGKDGSMSRTLETPSGKDVVKFDSSGKPVSRKVFLGKSDIGISQEPNPKDRLSFETDASGKTTIKSKDTKRNTDMTVEVGPDGKIQKRHEVDPVSERNTSYKPDGSAAKDEYTTFDKNGKKDTKQTLENGEKKTETFDKDGNAEKTIVEGNGYTATVVELGEGRRLAVRINDDGSTAMIAVDKDGTTYESRFEDGAKYMKTTNPDKSFQETIESKDLNSYKYQDKEGRWVLREEQPDRQTNRRPRLQRCSNRIQRICRALSPNTF